jgi:hypothetical protein
MIYSLSLSPLRIIFFFTLPRLSHSPGERGESLPSEEGAGASAEHAGQVSAGRERYQEQEARGGTQTSRGAWRRV